MSLSEYYDGLAEIALGWLGWTEDELFKADVNAIAVGFAGKTDMLRAVFGKSENGQASNEAKSKVSSRPMTFELFDALFSGGAK